SANARRPGRARGIFPDFQRADRRSRRSPRSWLPRSLRAAAVQSSLRLETRDAADAALFPLLNACSRDDESFHEAVWPVTCHIERDAELVERKAVRVKRVWFELPRAHCLHCR